MAYDQRRCKGCGRLFRGTTPYCIPCALNPPKVAPDVVALQLKEEFQRYLPSLIQLCHPDRHSDSALSLRMTGWLLEKKKELAAGDQRG